LTSVEGVSEVASVGGFVKQYQVTVDPTKLRAYDLSISDVKMAVERSNGEVGGRSIEMGEKEFILRGPDMRRGIAEWNGEGETVGGVVVVRYGANARQVIQDVKKKLDAAMKA